MPQFQPNESGVATRISASGLSVVTSANANLLGVFVPTVLTGQFFQMWHGVVTGAPVFGTASLAGNNFYRIPAYCSGGITICTTNEDVDLTIFWNPAG